MEIKPTQFLLTLHLIFLSSLSFSQTCNPGLTSGTWNAATQKGMGNLYGTSDVSITYNDSSLTVSDFSAGFIGQLGHTESYSVIFFIDCAGNLEEKTIESKFGPIDLSGRWDSTTKQIIINWEVPGSGISEQTIITL